jgi:hypothetical protein
MNIVNRVLHAQWKKAGLHHEKGYVIDAQLNLVKDVTSEITKRDHSNRLLIFTSVSPMLLLNRRWRRMCWRARMWTRPLATGLSGVTMSGAGVGKGNYQNRDGRSEQLLYNEEGHMRNILNWGNVLIQIQRFCWENRSGEVARLDIHMDSC